MTAWLDEDRLFSTDPMQRDIARHLYEGVRDMPILSPHGHTDPRWFAENKRFDNPASLFVTPDHYVFRMLHSQGVSLEELGIVSQNDKVTPPSPRSVWRLFAKYYYLFRGTPSRLWLDHGHHLASEADRHYVPGYPLYGRLRGLAELRGVITGLTYQG